MASLRVTFRKLGPGHGVEVEAHILVAVDDQHARCAPDVVEPGDVVAVCQQRETVACVADETDGVALFCSTFRKSSGLISSVWATSSTP